MTDTTATAEALVPKFIYERTLNQGALTQAATAASFGRVSPQD